MDAAASMTKREDQFRRTTRDLRTRLAKCTEVDGGFFENLLWTVKNLPFTNNKFVIWTLNSNWNEINSKASRYCHLQCLCVSRFKEVYLGNNSKLVAGSNELFSLNDRYYCLPKYRPFLLNHLQKIHQYSYSAVCWERGVDCVWNVMAHAQKPDFVSRRNGRVHLNRQGRQFSRLPAGELCASACRVCTACASLCSAVTWRLMVTQSSPLFTLHVPLPCVTVCHHISNAFYHVSER
jgi:hypothetical protein